KELAAQATRMLADSKATVMSVNLAGQWLLGRKVNDAVPLVSKFPQFDPALRTAVQQEQSLFVGAFFAENLDLRTLLDANFTFLNERLGQHYRIELVKGPAFQKVPLDSQQRGGILTQAAFLIATSNADEPSVPRRGVKVLSNLLCTIPPSPP